MRCVPLGLIGAMAFLGTAGAAEQAIVKLTANEVWACSSVEATRALQDGLTAKHAGDPEPMRTFELYWTSRTYRLCRPFLNSQAVEVARRLSINEAACIRAKIKDRRSDEADCYWVDQKWLQATATEAPAPRPSDQASRLVKGQ